MTTTANPTSSAIAIPYIEFPPYLVCHIQTSGGRFYHVGGKGFVTPHLNEATRHPVDPGRDWLALDGPIDHCGSIHCIAPLFITRVAESHVEVSWGNRHLHLSADDLVAQAGRLIWREVKHLHRGGYPFGPIVQLAHDEQAPAFAYFNIEIHPPPGQTAFLHPAPDDWDGTPRGIQTHLGLLGFSMIRPSENGGRPALWSRPVGAGGGRILLETGVGTRVESLAIKAAGQPAITVTGFQQHRRHRNLHPQLVALIQALESVDTTPNLRSLVAGLFPAPLQILTPSCP